MSMDLLQYLVIKMVYVHAEIIMLEINVTPVSQDTILSPNATKVYEYEISVKKVNPNYHLKHCNFTYKVFNIESPLFPLDCSCNAMGSISTSCDEIGICTCKENIIGEKCDTCKLGLFPFPGCNNSK